MHKTFKQTFLAALILFTCSPGLHAQKQLAITMDDPNTYPTPLLHWRERNEAILSTLQKHHIQAALFVCGMRIADANGKALLKKWDEKGNLICNHSYSHLYFNGKSVSAQQFISDFEKGDSLISAYKNYCKRFRFPFLKEGNNAAKRDSMRAALSEKGYENGHVTIDASDWYIDAEMSKALKKDPKTDLIAYKNYYIRHILDRAAYYDSLANGVFQRPVKHTLLIHHSLLNALFLDDLLNALQANGWQLIDAREAFEDPVFAEKPRIEPCGESIIWQCAKLNPQFAAGLRYPAEDGDYEKEGLEKALRAAAPK